MRYFTLSLSLYTLFNSLKKQKIKTTGFAEGPQGIDTILEGPDREGERALGYHPQYFIFPEEGKMMGENY